MNKKSTIIDNAGPETIVIKIGGSTLGDHDTTLRDLVSLQREGYRIVVVHGGGKVISQWMEREGTLPRFIEGLRVTDQKSLEIVTAVLSGLVNKQLVAATLAIGGMAVGLSGVDGNLLQCRIVNPDLGFVGEVMRVNTDLLEQILNAGYIPMVAPVGIHSNKESDADAMLLNINGDTVTGDIARSLSASKVIFLTDVEGVKDSNGRKISFMKPRQVSMFIRSGMIKGGMIPKLEACQKALTVVPTADIIDGRVPGALLRCAQGEAMGTRIQA